MRVKNSQFRQLWPCWEGYRQSSANVRGADKYKGKGVFKVNEGGKYKEEGLTNIVTLFLDENQRKPI